MRNIIARTQVVYIPENVVTQTSLANVKDDQANVLESTTGAEIKI